AEALLPLVYDDLRAKAGAFFKGQRPGHTLQPTALVHEAFIRLIKTDCQSWHNRRHFFAVAATAMRQVLANHARDRKRLKRGGDGARVTLSVAEEESASATDLDPCELHDAISELTALNQRHGRVVELRFLAGMTIADIAELTGVSKRTVELDWRIARSWLRNRLGGSSNGG
ncbi:MAG: ECF-type sigma factor, partial [Phycisphaerae bacterium]